MAWTPEKESEDEILSHLAKVDAAEVNTYADVNM